MVITLDFESLYLSSILSAAFFCLFTKTQVSESLERAIAKTWLTDIVSDV